ncbi:carotenoid 1,2-hydratase [Alteromonas sp. ASW11-19]|uniref:Carotenoid 1,2-hydratase n=1 Tax=Alteromonas salexigens TaxID=2982530 RepID=A0ABT2VQR3_9ALTE|nr:lipocalin-like domain-containing protein [Alteromonas salexigens]MCU7555650.1 carotenoid 1,2-hydratase [Alteromonas salexigens]
MIKRLLLVLCILTGCSPDNQAVAPGNSLFAGASTGKTANVTPAATPVLPGDHRSHDAYQLEWWYLTLVLNDDQGEPFAAQFTLFRLLTGPDNSDWSTAQTYMAHVSVHSQRHHWFGERFARGGVGNAGIEEKPFAAFMDDWRWQATSHELFPSTLSFSPAAGVQLTLDLTQHGPYAMHGDNGYSEKSADGRFRSYYYSQPFIQASGTLTLPSGQHSVSGNGWFDHEWTSALADQDALGWDWFSLHLDNGDKIMAFRMHVNDATPYVTGTYVTREGQSHHLDSNDIDLQPTATLSVAGRTMPLNWHMVIPSEQVDIQLIPFKTDQYNRAQFPYYEGRMQVSGTHAGSGFMELTGY